MGDVLVGVATIFTGAVDEMNARDRSVTGPVGGGRAPRSSRPIEARAHVLQESIWPPGVFGDRDEAMPW